MLAGIYWWQGLDFSLLEALMASDQAKITHMFGPHVGENNATSLALLGHAQMDQISYL